MEIAPSAQRFPEIRLIDFSICAVHCDNPKSLVQESGSIAFIGFDVGMAVAENTVVPRTKTPDGQTICRSAIGHEKGFAIGFEQRPENFLCLGRDGV